MTSLLQQLTFVTCLTSAATEFSCCSIQNEKYQYYATEIIVALRNFFHTGCISFLHSADDITDLRNIWFLLIHMKTMSKVDVYVSSAPYMMFNYRVKCGRNRQLNVIFSDDDQLFNYIMQKLNMSNARWLFFLSNNISLQDKFYEVDIPVDREVFVAEMREEMVYFSEVYRVHPTFSLEVHNIGNWSHAGLQCTRSPFFKRRNNLRGLQFKAVTPTMDPVVKYAGNSSMYFVGGYFGKVWSALQNKLNFSTQFLEPENEWGTQVDGRWVGMIGKIVRREAYVAVAAFSMTDLRLSYVDFLPPLIIGREMLYMRKPEVWMPNWNNFLLPFKWKLWICITIAIFILATCLTAISYIEHQYGSSEPRTCPLSDSLLYVFGSFCQQGQDTTPKSWACRIVYIVSFLTGAVLLAAYSASLVSFLTVQRPEMPFYDLKGLLSEEDYKFFVARGSLLDYFRASNDVTIKSVYKKMIAPWESTLPSLKEGMKKACHNSKYVFMSSQYAVDGYEEANEYANCNFVSLPESAKTDVLSMILQKNSPYTKILSHSIQEMKCNGELSRIKDLRLQKFDSDTFGVDIKTVAPILAILASGVFMSIFMVMGEILRRRRRTWCRRNLYRIIYHNKDEKFSKTVKKNKKKRNSF